MALANGRQIFVEDSSYNKFVRTVETDPTYKNKKPVSIFCSTCNSVTHLVLSLRHAVDSARETRDEQLRTKDWQLPASLQLFVFDTGSSGHQEWSICSSVNGL